jgi:hypothetical protein
LLLTIVWYAAISSYLFGISSLILGRSMSSGHRFVTQFLFG